MGSQSQSQSQSQKKQKEARTTSTPNPFLEDQEVSTTKGKPARGKTMDLIGLVAKLVRKLWPFAIVMWQDWGIQGLVALSLCAQIFLAIFGLRRKYMTSVWIRFLIWVAYLLSAYVATIALGKLTVVQVDDPTNPDYHAEMLGLLAPVLLIHLGNPNSITAYSIEDNNLGFRQLVNIPATVGFVVWVLIRCWDGNSPVSLLFVPLFVAGLTTAIGWVCSLDSVYRETSSVTADDIDFSDQYISFHDEEKADKSTTLQGSPKMILQAFYRFDCLKPHIANWLYHPDFVGLDPTKINEDSAKDVFEITEIELGFMYDVLYTKAPILYTRVGIIGRFIMVLSLVSALSGFSVIFKNTFLVDMYIMYTYAILISVLTYELYQTVLMPFSDWAVVKMIRLRRNWFMARIIFYLANICINQRRWSKTMGQLNLFEYCRKEGFSKPVGKVLQFFGKEETVKRQLAHTRQAIPWYFMEMLHKYMKDLEKIRNNQPFYQRGYWTFVMYKDIIPIDIDTTLFSSITQGFNKNFIRDETQSSGRAQGFVKSIIIWHIATELCLNQLNNKDKESKRYMCVKMISDYMMYLVALRPQLLSLTTTDVTMRYACEKIRGFLRYRTDSRAMEDLSAKGPLPYMEIEDEDGEIQETLSFITSDWDVLSDARNLAEKLSDMYDVKWDFMSSIWVEMLCYAAYNCQVYHHARNLRCGGELITHIWLILLHKTDKYQFMNDKKAKILTKNKKKKYHPLRQFLCG